MLSITEKDERRIAQNKARSIKRALLITPEKKAAHAAAELARIDAKRTTPKRPLGVSLAGLSREEKRARKAAQSRARFAKKGAAPARVRPPAKTDTEKNEYQRMYREIHKEQRRQNTRDWVLKRGRGYKAEQRQNRRALETGAEGAFTQAEWNALCERYGHRCVCCKEETPLTVDHIIPLIKGGTNYIQNLQPLCGTCNSIKGTKTIDYR